MLRNVTDLDLRLLRIFACVVKCGGFTAAQAELNMSQSNISMHIASLEGSALATGSASAARAVSD